MVESSDIYNNETEKVSLAGVRVSKLFGHHDLTVHLAHTGSPVTRSINVMYGENGSGKTTILRLLYELLHPFPGGGHRSWVAKLPFARATVSFSDSRVLEVVKHKGLVGAYTVHHTFKGNTSSFRILVDDENVVRGNIKNTQYRDYIDLVNSIGLDILFITDDRKYLYGSYSNEFQIAPSSILELYGGKKRLADGTVEERPLTLSQLTDALSDSFRRELAVTGLSSQVSTNSIYSDLFERIATYSKGDYPLEASTPPGIQ